MSSDRVMSESIAPKWSRRHPDGATPQHPLTSGSQGYDRIGLVVIHVSVIGEGTAPAEAGSRHTVGHAPDGENADPAARAGRNPNRRRRPRDPVEDRGDPPARRARRRSGQAGRRNRPTRPGLVRRRQASTEAGDVATQHRLASRLPGRRGRQPRLGDLDRGDGQLDPGGETRRGGLPPLPRRDHPGPRRRRLGQTATNTDHRTPRGTVHYALPVGRRCPPHTRSPPPGCGEVAVHPSTPHATLRRPDRLARTL